MLKRAVLGASASAASSVAQLAVQILAIAVISRLLSPAEFGLVAPMIALSTLIATIAEGGFGASIINAGDDFDQVRDVVLTGLIGTSVVGVVLFQVALTLAPGLLNFDDAKMAALVLSSIVILVPFSSYLECHLLRNLNFGRVSSIDFVAVFLGVLVGPLALAFAGFGVWSLIWGPVIRYFVKTVLYIIYAGARFRPNLSGAGLFRILEFSGYMSAAKVSALIALQGDRVVMAGTLPPATLGAYARAQNLIQISLDSTTAAMDRVLFPVFARSDKLQLARRYHFVLAVVSALTLPMVVVVVHASDFLVRLLLGPQWNFAVVFAQLLAPLIFFRAVDRSSAAILRRGSWIKFRAFTQFIVAALTIFCAVALVKIDMRLYISSVVVIAFVNLIVNQIIVARAIGSTFVDGFKSFRAGTITGVITVFCFLCFGAREELSMRLPALAAGVASGAVVLGSLMLFWPQVIFGKVDGARIREIRDGVLIRFGVRKHD